MDWLTLPGVCTIGLSRQVFNNDRENVDRLTSLRLQYLMLILKEAVPSVSNISDQERSLILQMAGLQLDDSHFVCLCTCDLLMSSTDWSVTWSKHLSESQDVGTLCEGMMATFGLERDALIAKNNTSKACKTTSTSATTPPEVPEGNATAQRPEDLEGNNGKGDGAAEAAEAGDVESILVGIRQKYGAYIVGHFDVCTNGLLFNFLMAYGDHVCMCQHQPKFQ